MEIIIEIPDDVYDECKGDVYFPDTGGILWEGVRNGIPLPKGHGRLIDADALNFNADYYELLISKRDFDFAQTIIEADTVESEDKHGGNCIKNIR